MRKKIFCGLCIVAALWACSESPLPLEGLGEAFPIELQGEVVQQYVTRASDGGFATGDQVGIYIVNHENGQPQPLQVVGNHADNVRYTYDAEQHTWTSSYPLYWKDKTTHADAYGYYPYDAELRSVEDYPFSIRRDQREAAGYEHSDFLWAKAEDVAPGTPIYLKYQHLMAGIQVTLIEGEDFEAGEWAPADKSVLVENIATDTYINIGTGEVGISRKSAIQSILPQQRGTVWRAVVPAQTLAADQPLLAITVNGESYHFQRSEAMTYLPGKLHKFTIRVDKRVEKGDYQFTLVSEAITAWENDAESHNGAAKEYVVVNITKDQYLGDVIQEMGLDPENIVNLKLVGEMSAEDNWGWSNVTFTEGEDLTKPSSLSYLRHQFPNLEALNLKDLRLKDANNFSYTLNYEYEYPELIPYDDIIPNRAFWGMHSLNYVVFPDHLKAIGSNAFQGCNLRMSCILPEGLILIGDKVFSRDDEWSNGGGGEMMESRCHLTGELQIPSTCRYIGAYAFYKQDFNCELILPEHMDYLGDAAFGGCKYMTGYLHIPEGLKQLNFPWWNMTGLKGFAEIPEGVTTIKGIGCPMSSLHVPEGVKEIESIVGYNYPNTEPFWEEPYYYEFRRELKEIFLPTSLNKLGYNCFAMTSIQHITLPDAIEVIPERCFALCTELQDTLYLPKSLYKIEQHAYLGCSQLTAIVLPENVGLISDQAFANCFSVDYIQCLGSTPPTLEGDPFNGIEKNNFTVVVPEGAVDAYRSAPGWSEFKRISAYRNFVCRPMQEKLLNKGHEYEVVLNADGNWSMTHCPAWAHVSKTSGNKKTELKVTVDDLAHGSGNRNDSIVFTLSGKTDEDGKPITCYYKLSQFDYQYEEDSELVLQKSTKGNGKVNIFICGDGYDAQDIAKGKYLKDMRQEMEYFFAVEPYTTYKDYFNVYTGFALSRESGIMSTNRWRETKFGTYYGNQCKDVRMTTNFDEAMLYALQVSPQIMPDEQSAPLVILVANSTNYDGVTMMWGDGSAVALCPMSTLEYPYDARGLVQHEAGGHGFGKLADEYIYHVLSIHSCNCDCCEHVPGLQAMKDQGWARNLSLVGKYGTIEWRQLIFDPQYGDICDIYEGGYFHQRGVFRSEANSCMNNNVPYFSTVSRMAIVERIKQYAGETFNYDEFVANDSRAMGDKFLTRGFAANANQGGNHGMHLSAPILKQGSVLDLLKKKK